MEDPKPPKKCKHPECNEVIDNPWEYCNTHLGQRSYVGPLSILHMRIRERSKEPKN